MKEELTKVDLAVRACRKRMSTYTNEQRAELERRGRDMMFPNGYWVCEHSSHPRICVANGDKCYVCEPKPLTAHGEETR